MTSSPVASAPLSNRSATILVMLMWGAYFQNYTDRQAVFAMFPVLRSELGLTDTQLGSLRVLFFGLWAVLSDR